MICAGSFLNDAVLDITLVEFFAVLAPLFFFAFFAGL
jgi:hypothetical protein